MGFFARALGIMSAEKEALIRRLILDGIRDGYYADSPSAVARLGVVRLMGTPEATIVTCVESWAKLKAQGFDQDAIASKIATFRGVEVGKDHDAIGAPSSVSLTIMNVVAKEIGFEAQLRFLRHLGHCEFEARVFYRVL